MLLAMLPKVTMLPSQLLILKTVAIMTCAVDGIMKAFSYIIIEMSHIPHLILHLNISVSDECISYVHIYILNLEN